MLATWLVSVVWLGVPSGVRLPDSPPVSSRGRAAPKDWGALYGLLATGIGAAVFAYGAAYLPWHLEHDGRSQAESQRFWPWMVLFMASMVGLAWP